MKKVLISTPVHQDKNIFKEYLWSLNRLIIPKDVEIKRYFYLHNCEELKEYLNENEYEIVTDDSIFNYDINGYHDWNNKVVYAVNEMRSRVLEKAREENYDYVFQVDSDLILHKMSLIELINNNSDITSKITWTKYNKNSLYEIGPTNCYDYKRNGESKTLTKNYKIMGIYNSNVICTDWLINKKVIDNQKVDFRAISNSKIKSDDYNFALKALSLIPDLKTTIDTTHPARHLYHREDYENWIKYEKEDWEKEC